MPLFYSLIAIIRLIAASLLILLGILVVAFIFPLASVRLKNVLNRGWSQLLLAIIGLRVRAFGQAQTCGTLVVANHISWLDILVLNAIFPTCFVAKSEINTWLILGFLVRQAGTLFIDRSKQKDAIKMTENIANALKNKENVSFFPEGTTSDGAQILPFKSSLLQAAVSVQADVQPVLIRYPDLQNAPNVSLAYVGEMTMLQSIWNVLKAPKKRAEVHYLMVLKCQKLSRQALAAQARDLMLQKLENLRA